MDERRALRTFEAHLEEVIGVEEARAMTDRLESYVTREYLDRALERQSAEMTHEITHQITRLSGELTSSWRRDLLLVTGAQFFALAVAVAALVGLA